MIEPVSHDHVGDGRRRFNGEGVGARAGEAHAVDDVLDDALERAAKQLIDQGVTAVVGHRLHGNADAVKGGFDAAKELIGAVAIP